MSRQTIAVSVKASKLTARALAYVVAAVGRKIAKEHRKAQTPHGKQSVRKLMGHGGTPTPLKWTRLSCLTRWPGNGAWTMPSAVWGMKISASVQGTAGRTPSQAALAEYSRLELKRAKSRQTPIREQLRQAEEQVKKQPQRELTKEVAHGDR